MKSESWAKRNIYFIIYILFIATPIVFGITLGILHRWRHGRYTLDSYKIHVEVGMSKDEVIRHLGKPCEVHEDLYAKYWIYDTNCIGTGWFAVSFDENGKVEGMGTD